MTTSEFSNQFDVLYNNISSGKAPGLDSYEKSVFLTKAQDEVVKNYFRKIENSGKEGFDGNQKRQIDFSNIIKYCNLTVDNSTDKFDTRSHSFKFPTDWFLSLNEQISEDNPAAANYDATKDTIYSVVPITYADYERLMAKPYKYPYKNQAWRLIVQHSIGSSSTTTYSSRKVTIPVYMAIENSSNVVENTYVGTFTFDTNIGKEDSELTIVFYLNYNSTASSTNTCTIQSDSTSNDTKLIVTVNMAKGYTGTLESAFNKIIEEIGNVHSDYIDSVNLPTFTDALKVTTDNSATGNRITGSQTILSFVVKNDSTTVTTSSGSYKAAEIIISPTINMNTTLYYRMRYIKTLSPIILANLTSTDTIKGKNTITECELDSEIHEEILQRAVELAKISWQSDLNTNIQSGLRSE